MKLKDLLKLICDEELVYLIDYDTEDMIIKDDLFAIYDEVVKNYGERTVTDIYTCMDVNTTLYLCIIVKEADNDTA